jgi:hypothetical protein
MSSIPVRLAGAVKLRRAHDHADQQPDGRGLQDRQGDERAAERGKLPVGGGQMADDGGVHRQHEHQPRAREHDRQRQTGGAAQVMPVTVPMRAAGKLAVARRRGAKLPQAHSQGER